MTFTPDANISVVRITATVNVAGVIGGGDLYTCNNAAGTSITVTTGAGAAAGTTATTAGLVNLASLGAISCHIDSTATTRPISNVCVEYKMQ